MRRTNFSATTGFICCFLMILIGIATNGGLGMIAGFIHGPSAIVTFGGAFFAAMITADSFSDLLDALKAFVRAFRRCRYSIDDISQQIFEMSQTARKEGLLALLTTLYGSILANWVCIPVARKLHKSSDLDSQVMELIIEGVLSIQAGENPQIIKEKIRTFREEWEERQAG